MRWSLSLLFLMGTGWAWAQPATSPEIWAKNLAKWVEREDPAGARWITKDLLPELEQPGFPSGKLDSLQGTSGALRNVTGMRPSHIVSYLKTARFIWSNLGQAELWDSWHRTLAALIEHKSWKKELGGFLDVSAGYFEQGYLRRSSDYTWRLEGQISGFESDSIPLVRLNNRTLVFSNSADSVRFEEVSGYWDVLEERLVLAQGTMPWQGTALDPLLTWAEFTNESIKLSRSSVTLSNSRVVSQWFPEGLRGEVDVKLFQNRDVQSCRYPEFSPSAGRLVLDSIYPGVRAIGDVGLRGSALTFSGSISEPARMEITHEDSVLFRLDAGEFRLSSAGFEARHARGSILWEGDSIFHPDLVARYLVSSDVVLLTREQEGQGRRAFFDSYHGIEFDAEEVTWKRTEPIIQFGSMEGAGNRRVFFRSSTFFKEGMYRREQGIDDVHPLERVVAFVRNSEAVGFVGSDFGRFARLSESQYKVMLLRLAEWGYVDVNLENWMCTLLPKGMYTAECARGIRDFDVMQFSSQVRNGPNAQFSLLNGRLAILGIPEVQLSDSSSVRLYPTEGKISMGKQRNFEFNGRVEAGNLEFSGTSYEFDYESFQIRLKRIEELKLSASEVLPDKSGYTQLHEIESRIHGVSGALLIEHPLNRSGLRSSQYTGYPYLVSDSTSYVYFESNGQRAIGYPRDKVYYALEPFEIRSLDRLTKQEVAFQGTLISGGIFEDHHEPLVVMDDWSLGVHWDGQRTAESAYGQVAYSGSVNLDERGILGSGVFEFLTARVESPSMLFFLDSLSAPHAQSTNRADRPKNVPQMSGEDDLLTFVPATSELKWNSSGSPLRLMTDSAEFQGTVRLGSTSMTAAGVLEHRGGQVQFSSAILRMETLEAADADFTWNDANTGNRVIELKKCSASLDFAQDVGAFRYPTAMRIELPAFGFQADLNQVDWHMEKREAHLAHASAPQVQTNFTSLYLNDPLEFFSPRALLSFDRLDLRCEKVPELLIGDGQLIPDQGVLTLREGGKLDTLHQALASFPYPTPNHSLIQSSIQVVDGMHAFGSGAFVFTDNQAKKRTIPLSSVYVDEQGHWQGSGTSDAKSPVFLGDAFLFKGVTTVRSTEPFAQFQGEVQLAKACTGYQGAWLAFSAPIQTTNPCFPVADDARSGSGKSVAFGWIQDREDPFTLVPTFLGEYDREKEISLFSSTGWLQYSAGSYWLGDSAGGDKTVVLDLKTCNITGRGKGIVPFNGPGIAFDVFGDVYLNPSGLLEMKGTLAMNLPFDGKIWNRPASVLPNYQTSGDIALSESGFKLALYSELEPDEADELWQEYSLSGSLKGLPKEFQNRWIMDGIVLTWNPREDMWVSNGRIGMAWMGNNSVHRSFPGKIEIERSRSADAFRLYLHGDEFNWFFCDYKAGSFAISSTDKSMLTEVSELKEGDSIVRLEDGRSVRLIANYQQKRRDDFIDAYREFE